MITTPRPTLRGLLLPGLTLMLLLFAAAAAGGEDPAGDMEAARKALNEARYQLAADLYADVFRSAQDARVAGNALYWGAFARYRLGTSDNLREALELLAWQKQEYAQTETAAEGEALAARIYGELAQRGEADAAREVRERADNSERVETQMAALHALMQMDPEKARPVLERIVRGEKPASPEVRRNAVFMLCRDGDAHSEDMLIELLRVTQEPELQSELVMCLSMAQSEKSLDAIVEFFHQSQDPVLGEAAIFAMGRHGGDRAFALLADMVRDPNLDPDLRQQAMFGLTQTGRDAEVARIATDLLRSTDDPSLREMALYSLANLDAEIPDQVFMDLIADTAADEGLRAQALFFAAQRGDLSFDFLRDAYRTTESRELKQQICHVLTQMDDKGAALETLIQIVRTETDPEIRRDAVFWIGQFDNPRAADFLLEIIDQE